MNNVKWNYVEGINIDFEGTDITKDTLNAFMQELTARLHSMGKLSTIAVAAKISDNQSWLNRVDYRFLGQTVDYVIIMAYDEHYRGSVPGPISSIGWFKQVASYTANTIARDKVIMGIPYASYNDGNLHEIYFENAQSIQLKANEVINYGFRGAAFWRLGQEDLKRLAGNKKYNKIEKKTKELAPTPIPLIFIIMPYQMGKLILKEVITCQKKIEKINKGH